jgi:hypothetical protein
MLFAWMSRAVIERAGAEKGARIVRQAVRRYGEQRGERMALRARANGHPLTMANYVAYSEWEGGKDDALQEVAERAPDTRVLVHLCPWNTAWEENDLTPYGRYYCLEVDEALVRGFNPDLHLDVHSTLPNEGISCEFVFHDANLSFFNYLRLAYKKAFKPGKKAIMPWHYHLGHLFKTLSQVFVEEMGAEGQEAADAALSEFAAEYGQEAAEVVAGYQHTDFDRLPPD